MPTKQLNPSDSRIQIIISKLHNLMVQSRHALYREEDTAKDALPKHREHVVKQELIAKDRSGFRGKRTTHG